MATSNVPPGSWPGNTGIIDLQVDVLEVKPEYALNAVQVEIANPDGNGVRFWLDLGASLDLAMRLVANCMRLRGLTTP
jgi:hypothetical protein